MKKQKLLAALMALVMSASTLPALSVSAAEADEESVNLFDTAMASVAVETISNDLADGAQTNEYLHFYNRRYNVGNDAMFFCFDIPAECVGKTVYVKFNARYANILNIGGNITEELNRWVINAVGGGSVLNGGEPLYNDINTQNRWTPIEVEYTPTAPGMNYIYIHKTANVHNVPLDLDDFSVYYMNGETQVPIVNTISDGFSDLIGGENTFRPRDNSKLTPQTEDDSFDRIAAPASGNTSVTYTFEEPAVAGWYTLSGNVRLSTYVSAANETNTGKITVTTDKGEIATYGISTEWSSFNKALKLDEDITSITITADNARGLDLDNLSFTLTQASDIAIEDEDSLLDGAVISASDMIEDMTVTENTFLRIYNRPVGHWYLLQIAGDSNIVEGRTYYLSFDIRNSAECEFNGEPMNGCVGLEVSHGALTSSETGNKTLRLTENTTAEIDRNFVKYGSEWVHVEAQSTATASNQWSFNFGLRRGEDANFHHPTDIDNIKVWYYDENGKEVVVTEKDFEKNQTVDSLGVTSDVDYMFDTEVEYSRVLAAEGTNTSLTYSFDEVENEPEKYMFSAEVRVPYVYLGSNVAPGDNEHKLTLSYTLDNGETGKKSFDLTHLWTNVKIFLTRPAGASLSEILMELDTDLPLDFRNVKLISADRPDYGNPYPGITMVLLAKMKSTTKTVKETLEYVTNGTFDETFDFSKVVNTYNNLPANTWMNHSNYASKMESVEVDGNNVLSVSGIQTNWNGIAYGLGELVPGEYTFKMDIKLANEADKCDMRISVNDAYNIDSYIASSNGEIHTVDGKKWSHIEYNFIVKEPTTASIRIRGGMAGAPDTVPYYIDNLSVSTVVKKEVFKGETITETIELAENGTFDESFDFSKVVNTYNDLPANTWMNHSNYASKMETAEVDGNKVLSVSGIQTNWSGIAYGLGELQPGKYTVAVDLKLANASDACHMRFSVNNADNIDGYIAGGNDSIYNINGEEWTHLEYTFTLKYPTAATIRIRGGMNGAPDTVPYYIDNLSVTTEITRSLTAEEAAAN